MKISNYFASLWSGPDPLRQKKEIAAADNANRELIFYYADYANRPDEALRIAAHEFERRKDVYTLDAYGWALAMNGRNVEARQHLEDALAVGVRDAQLLYHAGIIAQHAGDVAGAANLLHQSLQLNPVSEFAAAARAALEKLSAQKCRTERPACGEPAAARWSESPTP